MNVLKEKTIAALRGLSPGWTTFLLALGLGAFGIGINVFMFREKDDDPAITCRSYCEGKGKIGRLEPLYDPARTLGGKGNGLICKCS